MTTNIMNLLATIIQIVVDLIFNSNTRPTKTLIQKKTSQAMRPKLGATNVRANSALRDICANAASDHETIYQDVDGIPYATNCYWSQKQRDGASMHEFSYHGCFKSSMPAFFIENLSEPGDIVFDPYGGRGTTLIESARMDRCAYGSDINPLFPLVARPRLNAVFLEDIAAALDTIDWSAGMATRTDLYDYFHPETFLHMESLRLWIAEQAPLDSAAPDPIADWIRMVSLHVLTGHSKGFISGVKTFPPGRMKDPHVQKRHNLLAGVTPVEKDVRQIILKKSKSLLKDGCVETTLPHRLEVCTASDKGKAYPGEHDAIVDAGLWDSVHATLQESPRKRANNSRAQTPALLKGMIFSENGAAMTPTSTKKGAKLYRYYVSMDVIRNRETGEETAPRRLAAGMVEDAVVIEVRRILQTPEVVTQVLAALKRDGDGASEADAIAALYEFNALWPQLFPAEQARVIQLLVRRITVTTAGLVVEIRREGIAGVIREMVAPSQLEAAE